MVSRFERCRTQFADATDLWLAAESSVQLHEFTISSNVTHSASAATGWFDAQVCM